MMQFSNRFFFLTILLFIAIAGEAQKLGIPELEYFNRRQYQAATQNWKISQSNSDLLYFGNNDGLLEYDGVEWRVHRDMGDFIARSVTCIDNKIYTGAYNEFGYFQYDSLYHLQYISLTKRSELNSSGNTWNIHDWGDRVVFQTEVALYIFKDDHLSTIVEAKSRFSTSFVVNDMLLVHDDQQGLMELRGEKVYPVVGGAQFAGKEVTAIMAMDSDQIVIATMKHGLYIWNMQNIENWPVAANDKLKKANIFCGVAYDDKYLVFGTIQNGLLLTDLEGNLVMEVDKDKGLVNNTVLSLFVDKEGNIWCGLDNGICRVNLKSGISYLSGYYDLGTGYIMDRDEVYYYLGTNQGLFSIEIEHFNNPVKDRSHFNKINGADGQVWSLNIDETGILCGHNIGVLEIKNGRAELITPPSVNGVWKFIPIPDRPELMLAGTYNGLILLKKQNGRWLFDSHVEGFNESSRYAEWDEAGNLWVSHGDMGIYQLSFEDDYKSIIQVNKLAFTSFPENKTGIVSRVNNRLTFMGTEAYYEMGSQGIVGKDMRFDAFFEPGNYPNKLIEDRLGNIWFFIENSTGVLRRLEDGTYKKIVFPFITLEQKLVSAFEFIYVADNNNVFFGVEDGFAHYMALDNTNFSLPFKVHIRGFKGVSDSLVYTIHQSDKANDGQLIIPEYKFRNNAFEINYAATFFQDKDMLYSTELIGKDAQQTAWSSRTSSRFNNLKEGDYQFIVRAKNQYGVVSMPLSFYFRVHPPWHRHLYAKIAYAILVLLLATFVIYLFNRRIEASRQREKIKQRERFKAREEQLTNEALRAEKEMIKLRNEKLRNEMLFKEKELANSTMNIIQKNEFLATINERLKRIKSLKDNSEISHKLDSLIKKINKDLDSESHWEVFELHLEQVHADFLKRLKEKHPGLSSRENKLCAYIRMGMSSKEIAVLMNVSYRAVENNRYRLRQNLNIESGENLSRYINGI
ncbi:MAG: LuxR C-terminal-related transcriptional regulator [Carboxylicivirga sp.]|jgi:ligand-binding sensor domain-containing protein/DNA-binding CsgD family transcriptional regulator|nr:LuxR C-terminal-related transcriptional regulator [Carboxylicivirga sp.]